MRKVNVKEISKHEGEFLARDVFYNGQLLAQSNSLIDKTFINRVTEVIEYIPYVFTYSSDTMNNDIMNLITDDILDIIKHEMEMIFRRYSYSGTDDIDLLKNIIDIFLNDILKEKYFKNYLENLYIVNNQLFGHSIRVTIISLILAIKANLNQDIIKGIAIGSILHEIGRNKIFIDYPILADHHHTYNQTEYHLIKRVPILGYDEVLNNKLVPLISKKIILLHNVWDDFEKSYDSDKGLYMSYPDYYKDKKITSEQKDIAVNIVQAANYFDMFAMRFKNQFPSLGERKNINKFFVNNSSNIFSRKASELITKYISYFSIGENVTLSNGTIGIIEKHTNNPMRPIIKLENGTLLDLSDPSNELSIVDMIDNERSDNNEGNKK